MTKSTKCVCCKSRPMKFRGLCSGCYQTARSAVQSGVVTWERLEKQGLAKRRKRSPMSGAIEGLRENE